MNPLRRVMEFPILEVPAMVAALAVTTVVEVGLRTLTLPRLACLLGTPLALAQPDTCAGDPQARFALPLNGQRQVRAALRVLRHWPFGDSCLRQALVCGQRLRRYSPELHVGVAKLAGDVRAHAWLVIGGGILDPRNAASSYLSLTAIPSELRP